MVQNKTTVYNDNMACVKWSKSKTTKGLRYIQIRENSVRENPNIKVDHVSGKINPADIFNKEDKDVKHYQFVRDKTVTKPFQSKTVRFCDFHSNSQNTQICNHRNINNQNLSSLEKGGYCTNKMVNNQIYQSTFLSPNDVNSNY